MPNLTTDPLAYLSHFLSRELRISTTDGRLFIGTLKCIDRLNNVILSLTNEYRLPKHLHPVSSDAPKNLSAVSAAHIEELHARARSGPLSKRTLESRYVGLVVLPAAHVVSVRCEIFRGEAGSLGLNVDDGSGEEGGEEEYQEGTMPGGGDTEGGRGGRDGDTYEFRAEDFELDPDG